MRTVVFGYSAEYIYAEFCIDDVQEKLWYVPFEVNLNEVIKNWLMNGILP